MSIKNARKGSITGALMPYFACLELVLYDIRELNLHLNLGLNLGPLECFTLAEFYHSVHCWSRSKHKTAQSNNNLVSQL